MSESQSLSCKTRITVLKPRCFQHGQDVTLDNAGDSYNPLETAPIKQITSRETIETRASRHQIRPFSRIFVQVVSRPKTLSTKAMEGKTYYATQSALTQQQRVYPFKSTGTDQNAYLQALFRCGMRRVQGYITAVAPKCLRGSSLEA